MDDPKDQLPAVIAPAEIVTSPDAHATLIVPALIAALVAFGWAFITGLLFMGLYFAVIT